MSYHVERIVQETEAMLRLQHDETLQETSPERLHECLGRVLMMEINDRWTKTKRQQLQKRRRRHRKYSPASPAFHPGWDKSSRNSAPAYRFFSRTVFAARRYACAAP